MLAKTLCEHGIALSVCKPCRPIYDRNYAEGALLKYKSHIANLGCLSCGFNHPSALHVHHLATDFKRYGRSQSHQANLQDLNANKAVVLCANCHDIFHGAFGGKNQPFPLLSKEELTEVINKERNPK